jgi:hypothetical protein
VRGQFLSSNVHLALSAPNRLPKYARAVAARQQKDRAAREDIAALFA